MYLKFGVIAVSLLATPVFAQSANPVDPARAIMEGLAIASDVDSDGYLELAELEAVAEEAFAALDANEDGVVTLPEYMSWDIGFQDMAEYRGRTQAFETATTIVFDLFDHENDGQVTLAEHLMGIQWSMAFADSDGDDRLSREEYYRGFIFNVALRAALTE